MANLDPLILGGFNSATWTTTLTDHGVGESSLSSFVVIGSTVRRGLEVSSSKGTGVWGYTSAPSSSVGAGVVGGAINATGVLGASDTRVGVKGTSRSYIGVVGVSNADAGVYGHSDQWTGVVGSTNNPATNYAGFFWGPVGITGRLIVLGGKSAAVPFPDRSYRLLYSVESPESWFEDFGSARLVRGRARVRLDRDFAAVVRLTDYHVFISPEGESRGLYVSKKSKDGFEVREQQGGAANVRFSYRVVAQRKDFTARRFARVALPKRPEIPEAARMPERPAARRRKPGSAARKRRPAS